MALSYRKAAAKDADRINALFVEMLQSVGQTEDSAGYEDGYLDKFFGGGEDWICIAEDGEEIVGFLSIEVYREEDYIYLDDLSVTEAYRRRGIGTEMLRRAEEFAGSIGVSRIILHVEAANDDAHRLYRKLGFIDDEVKGNRIRMYKPSAW